MSLFSDIPNEYYDTMIATLSAIVIPLFLSSCAFSFPINASETSKVPTPKVLDFLQRFGYIEADDANSSALYTEEGISDVIKTVQKFGALEQTGILDTATLQLMSSPRCGVPDIIRNTRQKRYAFGSEGWNKRTITYFIANWAPTLGEQSVSKNIELALNTWGEYGRLTFKKTSAPDADIIVAFGNNYHGDRYPFDGPGNILAHAFFPYEEQGLGGDMHFDADEKWVDSRNGVIQDGMEFVTVALHELGHSLGLSHSADPNSVMFPYYQDSDPQNQLRLGYDDILAMYELYIRRNIQEHVSITNDTDDSYNGFETTVISDTVSTTTDFSVEDRQTVTSQTSSSATDFIFTIYEEDDESVDVHKHHDRKHDVPSTNFPSLPNICEGSFNAVAVLRDEIFIFKEQYVWRLQAMSRIESGYPILINQMFPDLPKSVKEIDAVYERPDGMIVLFIGNTFWVYDGKNFVEDSPRPISFYGLPSTLDKIDAVQVWARNGKTYFYKADRFWRYNETIKQMDVGYPRHMERWRGVPHNLDAATTWKGVTYFFKDELYWKFDNDWVGITDQSPLPAPQLWLGCPEDIRSLSRL